MGMLWLVHLAFLYSLGMDKKENTATYGSSTVGCMCIHCQRTCLQSCCLAIDVFSGSAILASVDMSQLLPLHIVDAFMAALLL
jgi:phenylacetate-coenzyme A ligase PaaK-like adenylate-forming protein